MRPAVDIVPERGVNNTASKPGNDSWAGTQGADEFARARGCLPRSARDRGQLAHSRTR